MSILIEDYICNKNPDNPSYIYLILTNNAQSFLKSAFDYHILLKWLWLYWNIVNTNRCTITVILQSFQMIYFFKRHWRKHRHISPGDIFQNGRMHICNHCNAFNRQAHLKKFKLSMFLLMNVLRKRLWKKSGYNSFAIVTRLWSYYNSKSWYLNLVERIMSWRLSYKSCSLVVTNLHSETKGSRFECGC